MLFQVSSQLEAMNTRSDGTYKLVFGTNEMTAKEALQLFQLIHKQGWLLFKDVALEQADIPEEKPEFKTDKSPSKRLRSCLYVWWEQNTNKKKPFDEVWNEWCEKKCSEIKETLNP